MFTARRWERNTSAMCWYCCSSCLRSPLQLSLWQGIAEQMNWAPEPVSCSSLEAPPRRRTGMDPGGEPGWTQVENRDGPAGEAAEPRACRPADHSGAPRRSLPLQPQPDNQLGKGFISAANETTALETTMKSHEAYWLIVSAGLQGLTSGPTEKHRIQVSFLAATLLIQVNIS